MAAPTVNWVHDKGAVTEKDRNLLEKAKKMERREIARGYRWVTIERLKSL